MGILMSPAVRGASRSVKLLPPMGRMLLWAVLGHAAVPPFLVPQPRREDPASDLHRSVVLLEVASPRYYPPSPETASTHQWVELALSDTLTRRPTHWMEGAIVGGAVVGVGTFGLVLTICEDQAETTDCLGSAALNGAIGAFAGAVIGALIGGGIEKHPAADASESRLRQEHTQSPGDRRRR